MKDQTCEMEVISHEGPCGKPATAVWIHRDGNTLVCRMCSLSVTVNHGYLSPLISAEKMPCGVGNCPVDQMGECAGQGGCMRAKRRLTAEGSET